MREAQGMGQGLDGCVKTRGQAHIASSPGYRLNAERFQGLQRAIS